MNVANQCGTMAGNHFLVGVCDDDGCLLAAGHAGPHEFVAEDGKHWHWETDMECGCEHCMQGDGDKGGRMDALTIAAARLDILQSRENAGRGVSCVRALVAELRRGNKSAAAAVANNEWDKIASYPAIAEYIKALGLVGANAYITRY